jgi:hypothetical protein
MSTTRWHLQEVAGKILARRTELTHEAISSAREDNSLQSPIIIWEDGAIDVAGVWEEGHAHYPGETCRPQRVYPEGSVLTVKTDLRTALL